MKHNTRKRTLAFERLDSKCAPSTLLLALAPLDDAFHVAVEQSRSDTEDTAGICPETDTSANWQFQFSTCELLRFVEENTDRHSADTAMDSKPSAEQCRRVDEMMKLEDQDLRALVIADSLHNN